MSIQEDDKRLDLATEQHQTRRLNDTDAINTLAHTIQLKTLHLKIKTI